MKFYLFLLPLLVTSCVSNDSLLARQQKACQEKTSINPGSPALLGNVYVMSDGQLDVPPNRADTMPPMGVTPMSECMAFWDEELSRENAEGKPSVE